MTASLLPSHDSPVPHTMKTLGIDLAARARNTRACEVDWAPRRPRARVLRTPAGRVEIDDEPLVALVVDPAYAQVGVDVPFGWPRAFEDLLAGRREGGSYERDNEDYRLRRTDRHCIELARGVPLSVSSNLIAAPAMRWRMLRPQWKEASERLHEVYPAAALGGWGLPRSGYKKPAQCGERQKIFSRLQSDLGLESLDAELLLDDSDALDALIAALVARAIAVGAVVDKPSGWQLDTEREGWIELPTGPLRRLLDAAT